MTDLAERVHQRVWDLLPWYANSSLGAAEQEMVEGHLAGCPACRHEVESCNQLRQALRQAEDAVPSPHPVQLARLLARLDEPAAAGESAELTGATSAATRDTPGLLTAQGPPAAQDPVATQDALTAQVSLAAQGPVTSAAAPSSPASPRAPALAAPASLDAERRRRFSALLAATPRPVRWALAAQLVLLLGLAAMQAPRLSSASSGVVRSARPAADYVVLEQPSPLPRGPEIRLVFAEDATERQVRDLLLRIDGHLTGGPSPLGTYTMQMGDGAARKDALDYVLSYLRAQPIVRFAQPVAGSVPEPSAPPVAAPPAVATPGQPAPPGAHP